jgi:hypothetical protein
MKPFLYPCSVSELRTNIEFNGNVLMRVFAPWGQRREGFLRQEFAMKQSTRRNPTAPAAVVIGPLHQHELSFTDTQFHAIS